MTPWSITPSTSSRIFATSAASNRKPIGFTNRNTIHRLGTKICIIKIATKIASSKLQVERLVKSAHMGVVHEHAIADS